MFHVTFGATLTICSDLLCLGQVHSFHSSLSVGQCAQRQPTSNPSRYAGVLKIVNLLAFWNWHQIESESKRGNRAKKSTKKSHTISSIFRAQPVPPTDCSPVFDAFPLSGSTKTRQTPPPVFAHTIHSYRPLLGPVWPFFGI